MISKAYINGKEVSLETANLYHDIKAKISLGVELTQKEKCIYLLFIATLDEAKEYLKNEKN
jgi:hypothetical protein